MILFHAYFTTPLVVVTKIYPRIVENQTLFHNVIIIKLFTLAELLKSVTVFLSSDFSLKIIRQISWYKAAHMRNY